MTIRNRHTQISSLTFGVVFTISSLLVYYAFYRSSERIIFSELERTCMLSAVFYLEEDELSVREHNIVRKQFEENILNADVKIYNSENQITFGNKRVDVHITPEILDNVRKERKLNFKAGDHYYYGVFYPDNQGDFVVFIASDNEFFASQNRQLLFMLAIALLLGLAVIFLLSHWLSRIAYKPISRIINQVNDIEVHSLDTTLTLPDTRDELRELVTTFNKLLLRLSETFTIQKNFINYVSHEFKTPLAAISGNLEVFAQKKRTAEEYKHMAMNMLQHVYQIEETLNNLMLLSGLRTPPSESKRYRVDELLWSVLDRIYDEYYHAKSLLVLHIDVKDPDTLDIKGSRSQMEMALYNLMENAVKYADGNPVDISLSVEDHDLKLTICDHGRGIDDQELKFVHQAFYRGSNVGDTKGSGIGLSLSILICKQHNVAFNLHSTVGKGTQAELIWRLS